MRIVNLQLNGGSTTEDLYRIKQAHSRLALVVTKPVIRQFVQRCSYAAVAHEMAHRGALELRDVPAHLERMLMLAIRHEVILVTFEERRQ